MSGKIIIGVSGNKGSFSEEAAEYYSREEKIENFSLKYLTSVENVLQDLDDNKITKGIFPIENSNGGIVYEAVYAMAGHLFKIEKFFEIDVRHSLMTLYENDKGNIRKITSHPQALKQCRMYLKRKWAEAELNEWSDTAAAAEDLSIGKLPKDTAVIAPKRAADIYNLKVLEESIQDLKFNFTTFLAVAK